MITDSHIHTSLCKHATGEVNEYVAAASRKGIDEICFTDHAPDPDGYDLKHRMTIDEFPGYRDTIRALRADNRNPAILYGVEADYYSGCEKFLRPWLAGQDFDIVLGSIHYIKTWGIDNPDEVAVWDTVDAEATWKEYFELLGRLADTGLYDVVAHLDIPKKFGHRPQPHILEKYAGPALDRIAAAGMAIELNTSGLRKPVKEIYPSLAILQMANSRNIPVCFGSDSHKPDEVGHAFDQAVSLAKAAGYTRYARFNRRRQTPTPLS